MTTKTVYVAKDGKEFKSKDDCIYHEHLLEIADKVSRSAECPAVCDPGTVLDLVQVLDRFYTITTR